MLRLLHETKCYQELHTTPYLAHQDRQKIEFHFKMCPESNSPPSLCPGKSQMTLKNHQQIRLHSKKDSAIITIQISIQKSFYRKYADIKMFHANSPEMLNFETPIISAMMERYRSFAK